MKSFNTIHELVGHTKQKINELNMIVDTLLMEYRSASDLITSEDKRKRPLDELTELNETITSIVDVHPSLKVQKISQEAFAKIVDIAYEGEDINSFSSAHLPH